MIKIVIGGQMSKDEIEKDLEKLIKRQDVKISIMSDLDAAMAIQNDQADYYIGACETGAGGALAMATALLGAEKTLTVASPTTILTSEKIREEVEEGKKAFGFTISSKDVVLPKIVKAIGLG